MRTFALLISLLIAMPAVAQQDRSGDSFGDDAVRSGRYNSSGTTWMETTVPGSGVTQYQSSDGRSCLTTRSGSYQSTQCSDGR